MTPVVVVQFKRNGEFGGNTYDYRLAQGITPPKTGDIIRMLNDDGTRVICNGTRVRVVAVKEDSDCIQPQVISYVKSSMDEPSIRGGIIHERRT